MKIGERWIGWLRGVQGSRHLAAFAGAAALVVVFFCLAALNRGVDLDYVPLLDTRELSRDEIGTLQVAFGKAGLNDYEVRGARVVVPRHMRAEYFAAADDNLAIPPDIRTFERNRTMDFLLSPAQRRQLEVDQKRARIRNMLIGLGSVEDAKIEYDESRGSGLLEGLQRSATVWVKTHNDLPLDEHEVRAVRDMVRGAYSGLQSSNIVVFDSSANTPRSGADLFTGDSSSLPNRKIAEEGKYEHKIRIALSAYPGVRVSVEVAMDRVIRQYSQRTHLEGPSQPVVNSVHYPNSSARAPSPFQANMLMAGTNGAAQVTSVTGLGQPVETTYLVPNGTFETEERLGSGATSVSVSIGVPEGCVKLLAERLPETLKSGSHDPTSLNDHRTQLAFESLKKTIQEKIRPLIPNVESVQEQVVVTMDPEIRWQLPAETSDVESQAVSSWWADNWMTLALIGCGFGFSALFVLRRTSPTPDGTSMMQQREFSTPIAGSQHLEAQVRADQRTRSRTEQNADSDELIKWQRSRVPRP